MFILIHIKFYNKQMYVAKGYIPRNTHMYSTYAVPFSVYYVYT